MSRIRSTIGVPLMIGLLVAGAPGCSKKAVQSGGDIQSSQQGIAKGPDAIGGEVTGGEIVRGSREGMTGGGPSEKTTGERPGEEMIGERSVEKMTGEGPGEKMAGEKPDEKMTAEGSSEKMTGGETGSNISGATSSGRDASGGLRGLEKNPSEERVGNNAGGNTLVAKVDPGSARRQLEEIRIEQSASAAAGLLDVFFAYDSFAISEEGRQALSRDAAWLKANPHARLKIEGHCDERGTSAYNLVLGEKRAKAVRNYLVELGVVANHLSVVSYGKERPFCQEHAESCYAQNRRGHVVVKAGK